MILCHLCCYKTNTKNVIIVSFFCLCFVWSVFSSFFFKSPLTMTLSLKRVCLRGARLAHNIHYTQGWCVVYSSLVLSWLLLSCLVFDCFLSARVVLSCLVLSCLVFSCFLLSFRRLSCFCLSVLVLPYNLSSTLIDYPSGSFLFMVTSHQPLFLEKQHPS